MAGTSYIYSMDEIVTLKEAAKRLGISTSTLRHQARAGRVRARLIGKTWVTTPGEIAGTDGGTGRGACRFIGGGHPVCRGRRLFLFAATAH